jgi:hypothetical protein
MRRGRAKRKEKAHDMERRNQKMMNQQIQAHKGTVAAPKSKPRIAPVMARGNTAAPVTRGIETGFDRQVMKQPQEAKDIGPVSNSSGSGNDESCVKIDLCKPRCISFRIDRDQARDQCGSVDGVFNSSVNASNPWDLSTTNHTCAVLDQDAWKKNITVLIREQDNVNSSARFSLPGSLERFTFCTGVAPCSILGCTASYHMVRGQ